MVIRPSYVLGGRAMEIVHDTRGLHRYMREAVRVSGELLAGVRPNTDEYVLADGRRLLLLAEGRLVNLTAAEGHPAAVMDMSFSAQALAVAWLAGERLRMAPGVYDVPEEIDHEVARLKLAAGGTGIDTLTPDQEEYLHSWRVGS